MAYRFTAIVVALFVITAGFGSAAYVSYSADREATIDVVADSSAVLQLQDNSSTGDSVTEKANGELAITVDSTTDGGVGRNVTMKIGDVNSPKTTHAFNVTNSDDEAYNLKLDYNMNGAVSGTQVSFKVYNSTGTLVGTESDGSANTFTDMGSIASGSTWYVVVVIDTTSVATTDDLGGTLTIKTE